MKKGVFVILMAILVAMSVGLTGCDIEPEEEEVTTGTLKVSNTTNILATNIVEVGVTTIKANGDADKTVLDDTTPIAKGSSRSYSLAPNTYYLYIEDALGFAGIVKITITQGGTTSISYADDGIKGGTPVGPSGPATVAVTGVTVSAPTISLTVGSSQWINPTVSPANATNTDVTYTSSAPAIATVTSGGRVDAVSAGTATITVKTVDGNKTATVTVTVTAAKGTLKILNDTNVMPDTITSVKIGSDAADTVSLSKGQNKDYALDPGTYIVIVTTSTAWTKTVSVTITAGGTKTVALTDTDAEVRAIGLGKLDLIVY